MRVSLVGRLASLAALASLGALLVLRASHVVCLLVVIDANLWWSARRPACVVELHMLCVVS